jgi:2'-5' RNA ligase
MYGAMVRSMSGNNLRLFVAADIPRDIRELYAQSLDDLRREFQGVRWVHPRNLHLTLKFIGQYEEVKLPKLIAEANKCTQSTPIFDVVMGGCGAFPSPGRARVVWAGMAEGKDEASRLASKLDSRLEKAGVKRERRPFRGHLTLARLRPPADCSRCLDILGHMLKGLPEMPFTVSEIVIYESVLSPQGPTYTTRERLNLEGV